MNRFWGNIILPIIELVNAKHIIEIGSDFGKNTLNILEYCKKSSARVSVIDPFPKYDYKQWVDDNIGYLEFYKELSLNALPIIQDYDAVLIDGDHNWYTVYNELKLIERNCKDDFPIAFIHDIDWPYARRDLYYNPDVIPDAYRKPYEKKGMKPGQSSLLDKGGFNPGLFNSIYENTLQNGVLTAVEDFISQTKIDIRIVKVYGLNGLGILVPTSKIVSNNNLKLFLDNLECYEPIIKHIRKIDTDLVEHHISLLEKGSIIRCKERNEEVLRGQLEEYRINERQLNTRLDELILKSEQMQEAEIGLKQQLEKYQTNEIKLNNDLNQIKDKLIFNEQQIKRYEELLEQKKQEIKNMYNTYQEDKITIIKLKEKLNQDQESIGKLVEWIENLNLGISTLLNSKRWKVGNNLGKFKNRILFEDTQKKPEDFIARTLLDFKKWSNQNEVTITTNQLSVIDGTNKSKKFKSSLMKNKALFTLAMLIKYPLRKNIRYLKAYFLLKNSLYFDEKLYISKYQDVKEQGIDPLLHYLYFGGYEGRIVSKFFDSIFYLNENPDVVEAKMNPLVHYIFYGAREGREPISQSLNNSLIKPKELYSKQSEIKNYITSEDRDEKTKVSIILPTWNREKVISRAIDSVLKQTYSSYELLIIDDGSTDKTEEFILNKYSSQIDSGKFRFIKQEHSGVCRARNNGLVHSKGELIAYLDSDNKWNEDYLEKMVAVFDNYKDYSTAYSAIEIFDNDRNKQFTRRVPYDRKRLLTGNFIDLNIFMHRRVLFEQLGGFDETLKRLVDWEYIIRLTKLNEPYFVDKALAKYYLNKSLNNITTTENLESNKQKVIKKHRQERISYEIEKLKIGYVLWDYPAFSQTFVLNELRWLVSNGYDVKVYYKVTPDKVANVDFKIDSYCVKDSDHLAELLIKHERNILHTHFAYPACTLLTYPAALKTDIPFTFSAHAVDIFHHKNEKRNQIDVITNNELCLKVYVPGEFHRQYLIDKGVPVGKIMLTRQAAKYELFEVGPEFHQRLRRKRRVISTIARFIEKKGLEDLIKAASYLKDEDIVIRIYGYGPLKDEYAKLISELRLDNVEICGILQDYNQLKDVYGKTDIFVLPCVRASDGDMDGIPTVILEAMSFGVPVLSSTVSVIPEIIKDGISGFLVSPHNPREIADKIKYFLHMSSEKLRKILLNARAAIDNFARLEHTMQALLDIWTNKTIDIFLVTYNNEKYQNIEDTKEIINRIYKYTTTAFNLTIVDNHSDSSFIRYLRDLIIQHKNIKLIELNTNLFCGPASNIALKHAKSEYIFYICSKEGFIVKAGWERQVINYMMENPDVGMAGHLIYSPKFYDSSSYQSQVWFEKFRNKEFAVLNGDRKFKHIQGGLYVLRREAYKKNGGFNELLQQNYMDVEFSYYLESCGWKLGNIENIVALTTKTRPSIGAYLDENIIAVHPLSSGQANQLDYVVERSGKTCNICNWRGDSFIEMQELSVCPNCNSTGFSRAIFKYLAQSDKIYRNLKCLVSLGDKSLESNLHKMFDAEFIESSEMHNKLVNMSKNNKYDVIIFGNINWGITDYQSIILKLYDALNEGGFAIINSSMTDSELNNRIGLDMNQFGFEVSLINYNSEMVEYEWRDIFVCTKK